MSFLGKVSITPRLNHVGYVFRGTTIKFSGTPNSINIPATCTSTNPVKALLFALECVSKSPGSAVVYIADYSNLNGLNRMENCLAHVEDEIAFEITPIQFYPLTIGYVHIADFQRVLAEFDIDSYKSVRSENLTELCEKAESVDQSVISQIVERLMVYLKK